MNTNSFPRQIILILSFIFLFLSENKIRSQNYSDNLNISYGIKSWDPVHIKIDEKAGSAFYTPIRFTAVNSTYYPFKLVVDFPTFENLFPKPPPREISISHGTNNLFTFSVHVPGKGYSYKYNYSYWLTPSDEILDDRYPYLIPIQVSKRVNAKYISSGKILDSFIGNVGDTVYSMRRGLVVAVPIDKNLNFRLSNHDCLEILHEDGTYMIYHHLNKKGDFTAPGKIVLPGQPVGLLSDSLYLIVSLIKVSQIKNVLLPQPITYSIGANNIVSFDDLDGVAQSVHPIKVVTRELKGRELKKIIKK